MRLWIPVLWAMLLAGSSCFSQSNDIIVNVQILPPYSPYYSTYVEQPNKVLLTLVNTTRFPQRLKLQASMTGDNGVAIRTASGFTPAQPIEMAPLETKAISLNSYETRDYFDLNHIELTGITKARLVQNQALPEGDYQLCVRAFDYAAPNAPRSMDACANLPVHYVDPPIPTQPACQGDQTAMQPQFILFSWTPPATASGLLQYEFTLKEVPNAINPYDVIKNAAFPVLFNTTQTGSPSLPYTSGMPQLETGKKYVWRVKVLDPTNQVQFKNGGYSDACWFVYKSGATPVMNTLPGPAAVPDKINIDVPPAVPTTYFPLTTENQGTVYLPMFVLSSNVTGRAVYHYPGNADLFPLRNATLHLKVGYEILDATGHVLNGSISNAVCGNAPMGKELAVTNTDYNGNFSFSILPEFDFGIVAESYTSSDGEFSVSGKVNRYAYIEMDYPHAEFFEPVFEGKYYFKMGTDVNIGDAKTMVLSKKLEVTITRSEELLAELENTSNVLANANVYLCRKPLESWQKVIYPEQDGWPDNQMIEKPGALDGLEVVAKGETDAQGKVTFSRMVEHNNWSYMYYVYADFPKDADGFSNYHMNGGPVKRSYSCGQFVGCDIYAQKINMSASFPRISGWLEDETDGKRLPGLAVLNSLYVGANKHNIISNGAPKTYDENDLRDKMLASDCPPCITTSKRFSFPGNDGRFEFIDQPIHFFANKGNITVKGPFRSVNAYSAGYDDVKGATVKSPLLIGEQAFIKIPMKRGAVINGRIIDGETKKGISAEFYFLDDNGHSGSTNSNEDAAVYNAGMNFILGTFGVPYYPGDGQFYNYPAKKLSSAQKLVVKAKGYITDTISVVADKKVNDLGNIPLYTLKRRLSVIVVDPKEKKFIKGATVSIQEVKQTCTGTIQAGAGEVQVNTKYTYDCPISQTTNSFGVTDVFSFENAGGMENNGQLYTVRVTGPEGTEYVPSTVKTTIPYSSSSKYILVSLDPGTCVSGYVYEGASKDLPSKGAEVRQDIMRSIEVFGYTYAFKDGEEKATTDASGHFMLHHIPLRSYPAVIRAIKPASQFLGDSFLIVTDPSLPSVNDMQGFSVSDATKGIFSAPKPVSYNAPTATDNCKHHDFHLSVYNGMDITSLMGFPIAVTQLQPEGNTAARISGYFMDMPANNQFQAVSGQSLTFSNLKIVAGTLKNDKGIPVSQPENTPVNTNENSLAIKAYGVSAVVEDKKLGIYLDKSVSGKQYGVMKGKVHLLATEFGQAIVGLNTPPSLLLPSGNDKTLIPVFNADKSVTAPANAPNGFAIGNSDGGNLLFSLPGFANHVQADAATSKFISTGELQLAARIQTNIADITPANLNIDAGVIKMKKGAAKPTFSTTQPVSFQLGDYWNISSSDWKIDESGLQINTGKLNTGVEFPISKIGISYNQLNTATTHVDINSMKLAKVHPVNITSSQQSFGKVNFDGGKMAWQIYVAPGASGSCGYIGNLPGTAATDKVSLHSINFYSNGQKNLFMHKSDLLLKNVLHYHTNEMASLLVTDEAFTINGVFDLNIPDKHTYAAALNYSKNGNTIGDVAFINVAPVTFSHPSALSHAFLQNHSLSNGLFKIGGNSEEAGLFPKTKTTFYYSNDSVSVWIDQGQSIPINGEREFANATGGMRLNSGSWSDFWFSGEMKGMPGISDVQVAGKPQRMKFIVEGDVKADGQSISMSDIATPFGNMSWTYNFPQSQLVGHCDIDMNVGSALVKGGILSVVDGGGWYFQASGKITLSGIGDADVMGIFGNYNAYPSFLSTGMGDMKCLPSAFQSNVKGFLFQAGIHKQVVPEISFEIPAVLSIGFGVDLGLTTRVWKSFGAANQFGISLLAKGIAHANGSCEATCSDIGAEAVAELGISGVYNGTDGSYAVNGCGSVGFELKVSQCLGALGLCGPCVTLDSGHKDLGVNLTYNSNSGADVGIQFGACDSQCN
ncbi:MAG: hypothetical protein U0T84_08075 [Chitinophagales bacterium]